MNTEKLLNESPPEYSNHLFLLEDDPYVIYRSFKQKLYDEITQEEHIAELEKAIAEIVEQEITVALNI